MAEVIGVISASVALSEFIVKVSHSANSFVTGTKELDANLRAISVELRSIDVVLHQMQKLLKDQQYRLDPTHQQSSQQSLDGQPTIFQAIGQELESCLGTIKVLEGVMQMIPPKASSRFRWIKQASRYQKYTGVIPEISRSKKLIKTHYKALHMLLQLIHLQVALNNPPKIIDYVLPYINQTRQDIQSLRSQQNDPEVLANPELKVNFKSLLEWADRFLSFAVSKLLKNDQKGEPLDTEAAFLALLKHFKSPTSCATAPESSTPLTDTGSNIDDLDIEVIQMLEERGEDLAKRGQWAEVQEVCITMSRKISDLPSSTRAKFDLNQNQSDWGLMALNAGAIEDAANLFTALHDRLLAKPSHDLSEADKGILLGSHQALAEIFIHQKNLDKAEEQARAAVRGRRASRGKSDLLTYESLFTLATVLEEKGERQEAAVIRQMIMKTQES